MKNLEIGCLTRDYLCLRSGVFKGAPHLAWEARDKFMHTPGICSFEVSPHTGKLFIGFDRHVLLDDVARQPVMLLLQAYFPELVASNRFHYIFRTLH